MKFGSFNNSVILCVTFFLWSCTSGNSPEVDNTTSQSRSRKDSAEIEFKLLERRDSLKVLLDEALIQLDSLTGIKNNSPSRAAELDKKLDSLKEEANALLVQMESIVE
jgi:hypothetical protein